MKHIQTFESFLNEEEWTREGENTRICKLIFDEFVKAKVPSLTATKTSIPKFESAYRPLLNAVESIEKTKQRPFIVKGEKWTIKFAPLGRYLVMYRQGKRKDEGWGLKAAGSEGQMGGELCTPSWLFFGVCKIYDYNPEECLNMSRAEIIKKLDGVTTRDKSELRNSPEWRRAFGLA